MWLFGDNNDYVGQTLKTDPMFQLDAHLTRDFTAAPLGRARRRLVQRRPGDHQRRRGREAQQPRRRAHARLHGQRQPGPHLRLQVDRQRQRARRPAHGRLHGLAGVRLAPAHRGHAAAEESE
ncbi:MAG: hypothetical protein M0C28_30840 [Candidatus Moduliflexus flocculans]|nr:hypothetical protein [Candidatus Moduliflexus flocculans]